MFMLRSTCFQASNHVYAQIYMPMCPLPCFCLDLHVSAQIYVHMLRSIYLYAPCHACVLRSMLVAMPCYTLALLSLDISLSCFLALSIGSRSRYCGLGLHPYTQAYIKGFGSFHWHVFVCLLSSMLYLHVSLSRPRLCHALCPSWACACMVISVPPRVCLDVTTCEIHLCGVVVLYIHLSPLYAMLLCLSCLLCFTCLAFFASLDFTIISLT